MCQQCDKCGICFKTKLDFRVTRDIRVFTMDATALVESALIRLAMLEKETAMLKADLGLALEAMKTLNIKEDVKVEAGGKFPFPCPAQIQRRPRVRCPSRRRRRTLR